MALISQKKVYFSLLGDQGCHRIQAFTLSAACIIVYRYFDAFLFVR